VPQERNRKSQQVSGPTNRNGDPVRVTTSFRVEPELLAQFRALARRNFRSPSWEFRRLMTAYIEEDKAA
jgi:hypothetical protein